MSGLVVIAYIAIPVIGIIVLMGVLLFSPPDGTTAAKAGKAPARGSSFRWNDLVPSAVKWDFARQHIGEFVARNLFALEGAEFTVPFLKERIRSGTLPEELRFVIVEGFPPDEREHGEKKRAKVSYSQAEDERSLRAAITYLRKRKGHIDEC